MNFNSCHIQNDLQYVSDAITEGCDESIVGSYAEYEDKAVELTLNPQKLARLRASVARHRDNSPLYDVPRWVKNLERAAALMWDTKHARLEPQYIVVRDVLKHP